jgi:ABC-2 type transport system ATP-binding protein
MIWARGREGQRANMHDRKFTEAALAIEGLSHWYGSRQALDAVTFALQPATFTVLLGLNGAGKSTLFSLVTRLYAVRRGRIRVFGHDVGSSPGEALRRLGVVFQPRTLDLDLSVMQNLRYHAALHGIGGREARARGEAILARVRLSERADDKVRNLSGGQMRRVEIARALLHRPRLLVLDEPTVGLDIKARSEILDHVHGLVAEEGVCVLWATHLVDEVGDKDDVIVLHLGKILAHGPASKIVVQSGAADIRGAFSALTSASAPGEAA